MNLNGEIVGINNAINARGPGIGFAIPVNQVKNILPQLKSKGRVERGYIGVNVGELGPELAKSLKLDEGLRAPIITNVVPGQPAEKAGLQAYDVILEVGGKPVRSAQELVSAITNVPVGDRVKLKVNRSGKERTFEVLVAKRPDAQSERARRRGERPKKKRTAQLNVGMELEAVDADAARELGLPENYQGLVVARVAPAGPAFQAGLVRGDVILEVDRKPVRSEEDFFAVVKAKRTYLLRVRRQDESGREIFAVITLRLAGGASDE